ncbi:MAG: S1 RNA-binding domain-containing protein [Ruminococcaceae bacterium]|nr:S1 RNA-binding domain-containing protein [Oscillospiraceae bacterium]MBR3597656.1 S1 RNA-binding domain-containing protein [Clostridia bacterium]
MQSLVGEIYEGKVTGLTTFGAFVKMSNGETGMVHISEVASQYVKDINEHLAEGQDVKVKVLAINENNKISLSIKQAAPSAPKTNEQNGRRPQQSFRSQRNSDRAPSPNVQKTSPAAPASMSFEDMMAKFKQESDEKISVLKKSGDFKTGSRRGYNK